MFIAPLPSYTCYIIIIAAAATTTTTTNTNTTIFLTALAFMISLSTLEL
jgi:hypothetical protein